MQHKKYWRAIFYLILFITKQGESYSQALKIGDRFPDTILNNVINYSEKEINTAGIKSKLIIIDFWGTGCQSCIKAFPHIDTLQKKFQGQVQFIASNKQTRDSTLNFFSKHKTIKLPSVPFVTNDTVLSKLFPYNSVPLHVWIDSMRIVRFITGGWNATDRNIIDFLNGKEMHLSESKFVENSTIFDPIVRELADRTQYYSMLTKHVSGVSIPQILTNTKNIGALPNRIRRSSSSIAELFVTAFSEGEKYNLYRKSSLKLVGIDSITFLPPQKKSDIDYWLENNSYIYDLVVPESMASQLYKFMQQDLIRYFNVNANLKKQKANAYVLTLTNKNTDGQLQMTNHQKCPDSLWCFHNRPIKEFVKILQNIFLYNNISYPLIDLSGNQENINISFPKDVIKHFDLKELRRYLNKYNYDLSQRIMSTDVLFITPKKQ